MQGASKIIERHLRQMCWCPSTRWSTLLAFVLVVLVSGSQAVIPHDLVVQTQKGKIRGVTLKSATNK